MAITSVNTTAVRSPEGGQSSKSAMAIVTTLFFVWGFLTCLNDILIPHLRSIFDLNYARVMMVQFVFFSGYAVFGIPAGRLVEWIGYKPTMVVGLLVMSIGAVMFIPAASVPAFGFFLVALIVLAAGITALQVSANPYVAVLGPPETASSRLNLAQALNSFGTTIAPAFGSLFILNETVKSAADIKVMTPAALAAYRLDQASTVKMPYLLIAVALAVLAVIIGLLHLPKIDAGAEAEAGSGATHVTESIWRKRHLMLGVLGIFVYVGAEVSIGSFLVNYFSQPEIGGISERTAANYVSFYWGFAMVGRFIGAAVLQKLRAGRLLGMAAIVAGLLVLASILSFGHVAMWTIILVGLFNSIMFPSIFTLAIAGLGPLTGRGSGMLVSAIVGGAVIPVIEGALADRIGIQHAFILPLICYVYIAYYGFSGSRIREAHRAGAA